MLHFCFENRDQLLEIFVKVMSALFGTYLIFMENRFSDNVQNFPRAKRSVS